jgi:hypothetical protein
MEDTTVYVYVVIGLGEGHQPVQEAVFETEQEAEYYLVHTQMERPIDYFGVQCMPVSEVVLGDPAPWVVDR